MCGPRVSVPFEVQRNLPGRKAGPPARPQPAVRGGGGRCAPHKALAPRQLPAAAGVTSWEGRPDKERGCRVVTGPLPAGGREGGGGQSEAPQSQWPLFQRPQGEAAGRGTGSSSGLMAPLCALEEVARPLRATGASPEPGGWADGVGAPLAPRAFRSLISTFIPLSTLPPQHPPLPQPPGAAQAPLDPLHGARRAHGSPISFPTPTGTQRPPRAPRGGGRGGGT